MSNAELEEFCTLMSEAADISKLDPQEGTGAAIDCIKLFLTTLENGRYIELCQLFSKAARVYAS